MLTKIMAQMVTFLRNATGAVNRTLFDVLSDRVNVRDFGAKGDGSNDYAAITLAWNHCLATGRDLYFPAGVYSSGPNNMPFKNPAYPASTLLDCQHITIYGDGPSTVLRSDSVTGADVLNLYNVKNLSIRNMRVTAGLTGFSDAGSNGCSIVGGWDNLSFDQLWFDNLPYVEKLDYLDGGKGFTIQTGTPAAECGTLTATNIHVNGCVYGFGLEVDLVNWATKRPSIAIDITAENCFQGVIFSAGEASAAIPSGLASGLKVRARLVNCQQDVILARSHGVDVEAQVVTSKSLAARRLNPSGTAWATFDDLVVGLVCQYAKHSRVAVAGNKGDCSYKARIGGATAGSSGLTGFSDYCDITVDLAGTASVAAVDLVSAGGVTVRGSVVRVTTETAAALPTGFYTPSLGNTVVVGPAHRFVSPAVVGPLKFPYTDGVSSYTELERDGFGVFAKQAGTSSGDTAVLGAKNHIGTKLFFIRNDGMLATDGYGGASAVSGITKVMPIYSTSNVFLGYVPIYTGYTP